MTFSVSHIRTPAMTSFCVWCRSTASSCRDFGTNCLEGTRMTSPQRWNTGGRRCSANRCWERSHSSFATHQPIKVWGQTTHLYTPPQTFLSSFPDAFCISLRMDRHAGLEPNSLLYFFKCLNVQLLLEVEEIVPVRCSATVPRSTYRNLPLDLSSSLFSC